MEAAGQFLLLYSIRSDFIDHNFNNLIFNEKRLSVDYLYGPGFMNTYYFESLEELKNFKERVTFMLEDTLNEVKRKKEEVKYG